MLQSSVVRKFATLLVPVAQLQATQETAHSWNEHCRLLRLLASIAEGVAQEGLRTACMARQTGWMHCLERGAQPAGCIASEGVAQEGLRTAFMARQTGFAIVPRRWQSRANSFDSPRAVCGAAHAIAALWRPKHNRLSVLSSFAGPRLLAGRRRSHCAARPCATP